MLWSGPADAAATFTVNKTGDAPDSRISDAVCDTSPNRGIQCTLRAAIQESNDTPNSGGPDLIRFSIGGTASVKTISPKSPLPVISDPVNINGYSQPGAKPNTVAEGDNAVLKVQINGSNAGTKEQGFRIRAADSTIKGLVINRFVLGAIEMSGIGVTDNRVEGNFIGTTADGTGDLGNGDNGVFISGAPGNTIGGTKLGARNVISGNTGEGIQISNTGATGNRVEGNFIGTRKNGGGGLSNDGGGVLISGAPNNTIGGTDADDGNVDGVVRARNVISGNSEASVRIEGSGATGNKVEGNFIGPNARGTETLNDDQGVDGVIISGAPNNVVGGTDAGARNVISGNGEVDVRIIAAGATGNRVEGNFIGTTADGTGDLGDIGGGVLIADASNNTIGGTDADDGAVDGEVEAANVIAGNRFDGVQIFGAGATGNSILSNRIFSNGELGIDLGSNGVAANDADDPDNGPNNLQNFPVITSVVQAATFLNPTRISGTLNSTPNQDFTVQCFLAGERPEDADPSGHGEGRTFMAEDADVTTNTGGDGSFECNFLFPLSLEGKRWSATATNEATGDTSEFSANFPVD